MSADHYAKAPTSESGADPCARVATVAPSPIGALEVTVAGDAVVAIDWTDAAVTPEPNHPILQSARRQLAAYFAGDLRTFDLPLEPAGDPFECAVWRAMLNIPYGHTETYGFIGESIGKTARAVGGACGRNPIPVVIPCHRVVGANGHMTGYSGKGGVETKQWLLRHEGALLI